MLSSVSSATSPSVTALNTASLLAQVREARKTLLVDSATNAVEPTYVKQLYNAYVQFFLGDTDAKKVGLEEIENVLKDQLNSVFSLISSKKTYGFPLDIAKILDENKLTNAPKKGNEAYKFYVTKIVSELNNLHEILKSAKENLSRLQTLIQTEDFENPAVRELLTQLRILETDGEVIKQTFSEYMVPKNFDITYLDVYKYDGEEKRTQTARTAKSVAQGSDAYSMPEATEIDWNEEKDWETKTLTFHSKIPDDISSVDDLRTKIKTKKLTGSRTVETRYFKKGSKTDYTDRYDTNADVDYVTTDTIEKTENDELSFFGELPLLDKLKYIILYYTKDGERRIFPDDKDIGFPCLLNVAPTGINPATGEDRKYTDDVNEIARLEPFYIGFLVDRDGPINALAAFMEIKSLAIGEQIKIFGYRIKALRCYLRFLHRGLEEVNKSQSNGIERIPNSAYQILSMLGCNPTRLLKTIDGKDYFYLQWNGDDGLSSYHTSPNYKYILVRADDEGMEEFIKHADVRHCDDLRIINDSKYFYNHIFKDNAGVQKQKRGTIAGGLMLNHEMLQREMWNYIFEEKGWELYIDDLRYEVNNEGKIVWRYSAYVKDRKKDVTDLLPSGWCDEPHDPKINRSLFRVITETDESKLPKELETNRMNITSTTNYSCFDNTISWCKCPKGDDKDIKRRLEGTYPYIVKNWKTTYDTVIGNVQAQLESINKSIESLRNKINTFDTSAANFRTKAYTIYNKTVDKIE